MVRDITEPGENTLKSCSLNDIPKLEYIRAIPRLNRSNIILINKPVQIIAVIKYDIITRKCDDMSELTNPDELRKNSLERET